MPIGCSSVPGAEEFLRVRVNIKNNADCSRHVDDFTWVSVENILAGVETAVSVDVLQLKVEFRLAILHW